MKLLRDFTYRYAIVLIDYFVIFIIILYSIVEFVALLFRSKIYDRVLCVVEVS